MAKELLPGIFGNFLLEFLFPVVIQNFGYHVAYKCTWSSAVQPGLTAAASPHAPHIY